MKSYKEVSAMERAEAIWKWWVLFKQDRGESPESDDLPNAKLVADEFGVHRSTAANWIEPLRPEFAGTKLDPRLGLVRGGDDE